MKKIILAILVFGLCLFLGGAMVVTTANENTSKTSAFYNQSVDIDGIHVLHTSISTFSHELDDVFPVSFIVESENSSVASISYESNGFTVVRPPASHHCCGIKVRLQHDGQTEEAIFSVFVTLHNGVILRARVFGLAIEGRLYINGSNFDSARDIFFSEMLESGYMTEEEYEILLSDGSGITEVSNFVPEFAPFSNQAHVQGTLQWKDDAGNLHPLQHTRVRVIDEDPVFDDILGTVYTDRNGFFHVTFNNNWDFGGGRDPFIRVWPRGVSSVVNTGSGGTYVWRSPTVLDVPNGSTTVFNQIFTMDDNLGRAFQVSQATIHAANYAAARRGGNHLRDVTVRFPHNRGNGSGNFYSNNTMYISGHERGGHLPSYIPHSWAAWDVIMHEYAHHIQRHMNITSSPGGTHWLGDVNMYMHYMSHHGGPTHHDCGGGCANPSPANAKRYAIRLTWAESWASTFPAQVQRYFAAYLQNIATVGDTIYTATNGLNWNFRTRNTTFRGEAVTASVMGVLWGIFDSNATAGGLNLGSQAFWDVKMGSGAHTLSEFVAHFNATRPLHERDALGRLLEHFGMSPSNINRTGGNNFNNPPTFTWTANGTAPTRQNNSFNVRLYSANRANTLNISTSATSLTLTQAQWSTVLGWVGDTFYVRVTGTQTHTPSTSYFSRSHNFTMPNSTPGLIFSGTTVIGYNGTSNTVHIPEGVTGIGQNAFWGFFGTLNIPHSVTTIGNGALRDVGQVILTPGRTHIQNNLFAHTNVRSVTIPNTVITIGSNAFSYNPWLNGVLEIPNSVINVSQNAFLNLRNLTINIQGRNTLPNGWHRHWNPGNLPVSFNGVLCSHDFVNENGGVRCVRCHHFITNYVIKPFALNGNTVKNTNTIPVDVWMGHEASGDGDWQEFIIRRQVLPNDTVFFTPCLFDRGCIQVWFEINGVFSQVVGLSNWPLAFGVPLSSETILTIDDTVTMLYLPKIEPFILNAVPVVNTKINKETI